MLRGRCMLMYAEHRRSSGDKPCCPLCRTDWGVAAVRALRAEDTRKRGKTGGDGDGERSCVAGAAAGMSSQRGIAPVTCRSCKVKVQAVFFRCLACLPAGSWVSACGNGWMGGWMGGWMSRAARATRTAGQHVVFPPPLKLMPT